MDHLIKRLENASGPDGELDEAIACAIAPAHPKHGKPVGMLYAPAYTSSIDAAQTLVPPEGNCHGFDISPDEAEAYVSRNNVKEGHWYESGYHPTSPAIALCIAALKARKQVANPK